MEVAHINTKGKRGDAYWEALGIPFKDNRIEIAFSDSVVSPIMLQVYHKDLEGKSRIYQRTPRDMEELFSHLLSKGIWVLVIRCYRVGSCDNIVIRDYDYSDKVFMALVMRG